MQIKKAVRAQQKLRLAISGPSGSGKTWSSLLLAKSIGSKKICVIDTEKGSASLYGDRYEFDTLELLPPFSPARFIEAIKTVADAGYDCIIIDSATHLWDGEGGCLDMVNRIASQSNSRNSYVAWGKVTPEYNRFIEAILQSPTHMIVTMRAKTAYELEKDSNGKVSPVKKGMEPKMRDGFEFEFTTIFELDIQHNFIVSKDRSGIFTNTTIPEPFDNKVGVKLSEWLNSGVVAPSNEYLTPVLTLIESATTIDELTQIKDKAKSEYEFTAAETGKFKAAFEIKQKEIRNAQAVNN